MGTRFSKSHRHGLGITTGVLILLSGCTSTPVATAPVPPANPQSPVGTASSAPVETAPATAKPTAANSPAANPTASSSGPGEVFAGTGRFLTPPARSAKAEAAVTEQGDITLNFVNADIKDVAKTVLGDYLKLNYEIAGNAQGSVTIQTSQPLKRSQVLPVLEQTLRLNGLAIVHSSGVYKVVPLADARQSGGAITLAGHTGTQPTGYGTEIVPLRYVGAEQIAKLIAPMAPSQSSIHADAARNLLIIEGTEDERRTLLEDIRLFDADWLSGMSFALYTPTYTDAEELTKELNQILGGMNSPVSEVIKLIPIDRLNAVLAISPQARYLEQIKAWVARLDRPGQGSDKRIFVYYVQNGRASDLAATLIKVMGGAVSGEPTSAGARGEPDQSATPGMDTTATATTPSAQPAPVATGETGTVNVAGMAGVRITADETNNALVILASPQEFAGIETALHQLDTAPKEVFLEAAIAEVTLTNDLKYGVQYFFQPSKLHQITLSDTKSGAIASAFPGLSYVYTGGSNIQVILDALSNLTHVNVLSSPELLVLNNQTATLQVGDQVPIVTQQAVSTLTSTAPLVNSVQYQGTGVILKVTPRVNSGGMVMMDISQEVSNVTNTTSSNIDSPTIQQRKIASSVAVQDGETVALGGLISDSTTRTKNGIPYLQRIPLLGNLFGDTENVVNRTELMVLITPHVIDNVEKARAITRELQRKLPEVQPLLDETR